MDGRVAGDPALELTGVAPLETAGPADLSFAADERRSAGARRTLAGALLVASEADAAGRPAVIASSPAIAFARWLAIFLPPPRPRPGVARGAHVSASARLKPGVSVAAGATVAEGARVGARTVIGPGCHVGRDAEIGPDCFLHANSVVLDRCRIGARCVLHAGAVVGSDGFGYVWDGAAHHKIPQVGIVRLEEDVEVGANSAIDRATLGETVVGRGTKIDNLVQVGHNVVVGEHSILCGQAGIAGSATLGARVTLAGQAGIGDHATLGDGVVATGRAGIVTGTTVPAGAVVSGMPALPHREFLKRAAWLGRLPELLRRVESLERRLAEVEGGRAWSSESPKS